MTSFDELGLSPALVEALAAEGFERPTAVQAGVIPVLRRGTSVLLDAGRGAGTLLAYGSPLLDRIAEDETSGVLVFTATPLDAAAAARSLARVAQPLGIAVAAAGSVFVDAGDAAVVFGTPSDLLSAVEHARLKLDRFDAWVVDGLTALSATTAPDPIDTIVEVLGKDALGVIADLPVAGPAEAMAERHLGRVVHVPPRVADVPKPSGKTLYYRVTGGERPDSLLALVTGLRDTGARVVALFRTEDQAADVGDYLELHGHAVGALADDDADVWISVDDPAVLEALAEAEGPIVVACHQVPADRALLDVAARDGHEWIALASAPELAHLRHTATMAGWDVKAAVPGRAIQVERGLRSLAQRLRARIDQGGLEPYSLLVEELLGDEAVGGRDPSEIAASALALLNEREPAAADPVEQPRAAPGARSWTKLFLTVGERDGVRAGDLLGAITGEAGVASENVGKIDVRESHSLVEVESDVAARIVRAVNGTSIRGRSVRVDYDRPAQKRARGRSPR